MSMSDTCKFEIKAHVDLIQKEKQISRRKAIATVADEIGLLEETIRKQDQRARRELGQIVPKKSNVVTIDTHDDKPMETPKANRGGRRKGAGRPKGNQIVVMEQFVHDAKVSCLHVIINVISRLPGDFDDKISSLVQVQQIFEEVINTICGGEVSFTRIDYPDRVQDVESLVATWRELIEMPAGWGDE